MNDRVTWLIPIKNGMPYLTETLASIESQTYTNWEIIAWDNGSTDGTLEELQKWIPDRLPGKIVTGEPLSVGASLARLVEMSETELCARIDADDINLPQRLEKQIEFLGENPDIAVVSASMYLINEQGVVEKDLYILPTEHSDIVYGMLQRNTISHPAVMFRKSVVLQVGNYQDKPNIEDYDLWLRISQIARFANLSIPLVKYRVHSNSVTQRAIKENRLRDIMDVCLSENALQTFGCSKRDMEFLLKRRHPLAALPIWRIARHLHKTRKRYGEKYEGHFYETLSARPFVKSVKPFVARHDILSYFSLIVFRSLKSFTREKMRAKFKKMGRKTRRTIATNNDTNHLPISDSNEMAEWLEQMQARHCNIHPSLTFLGLPKPYPYVDISEGSVIERESTIWISQDMGANPKLEMGKRAYIGRNTFIGVFKPIKIGECVLIGAYCYIISANHNYETRDIPIMDQGFVGAPIMIEDDVWLGTHVVVLPGVTIGKGAIVGAHSLVNKDIPPYEIWGGVPARFLKKRP
jgi:acetyltransferase-like isoleucine patch superfamily enzyme